MANFNGYNQPESNGRSNNLDDTIGMEQINSQNVAETNPDLSPENDDKKPSLAKKIIIGGAAVALAVAVGVGANSQNSNTSHSSVDTPEITEPNTTNDSSSSINTDEGQTSRHSVGKENLDFPHDGAAIISYQKTVSIPDLDDYKSDDSIDESFLNIGCKYDYDTSLDDLLKDNPEVVSDEIASLMDDSGYDGVISTMSHDGETAPEYPAGISRGNYHGGQMYCLYKGKKDKFKILYMQFNENSASKQSYIQFESDYIPTYDEMVEIWNDNPDLICDADEDDYVSSFD